MMTETETTQPALFRPPQISWRWLPVFQRNLLVWRKLAVPSLVGNIAEPLMWLVAFGYGLGALVGQVTVTGGVAGSTQVPYILFLASGSICMSAMNAASFEALYSAFSRMHVQKTWDSIMNAPVQLDDIVLAEMLWAAFKALFTVTAILGVMLALGISHSPKLLLAWPVLLVVAMLVLFVWPWGNRNSLELRDRYQQRSDLSRVTPGVFQASRDGQRVFFIGGAKNHRRRRIEAGKVQCGFQTVHHWHSDIEQDQVNDC